MDTNQIDRYLKHLQRKYPDVCVGPHISIFWRTFPIPDDRSDRFNAQYSEFDIKVFESDSSIIPDLLHCFRHYEQAVLPLSVYKNYWRINPNRLVGGDPRSSIPREQVPRWILCIIYFGLSHVRNLHEMADGQFEFDIEPIPSSGHANLLLIDTVNQSAERFEPHGTELYLYPKLQRYADEYIRNELQRIPGYRFYYFSPMDPGCFWMGLQQKELLHYRDFDWKPGFCAYWSLYYLESRLLNPDVERWTLLDHLLKESPEELFRLIEEYAIEVDSIIELLDETQKTWDEYQLNRIIRDLEES